MSIGWIPDSQQQLSAVAAPNATPILIVTDIARSASVGRVRATVRNRGATPISFVSDPTDASEVALVVNAGERSTLGSPEGWAWTSDRLPYAARGAAVDFSVDIEINPGV